MARAFSVLEMPSWGESMANSQRNLGRFGNELSCVSVRVRSIYARARIVCASGGRPAWCTHATLAALCRVRR